MVDLSFAVVAKESVRVVDPVFKMNNFLRALLIRTNNPYDTTGSND